MARNSIWMMLFFSTTLGLSGSNNISDAGATALANAPHLKGLTKLLLNGNHIGPKAEKALRTSPYLQNCEIDYMREPGD